MLSLNSIIRRVLLAEAALNPAITRPVRDLALASFMVKSFPNFYTATDSINRLVDVSTGEPNVPLDPMSTQQFEETYGYLVDLMGSPTTTLGRSKIEKKISEFIRKAMQEEKLKWPGSAFSIYDSSKYNKDIFPRRMWEKMMSSTAPQVQKAASLPDDDHDLEGDIGRLPAATEGYRELLNVVSALDDVKSFFSTSDQKASVDEAIISMRSVLAEIVQEMLESETREDDDTGFFGDLNEGVFDLGDDVDLDMDADIPLTSLPRNTEDVDLDTGAIQFPDEENSPEIDDDTEAVEKVQALRDAVSDLSAVMTSDEAASTMKNADVLASKLEDAVSAIAIAAGVSLDEE